MLAMVVTRLPLRVGAAHRHPQIVYPCLVASGSARYHEPTDISHIFIFGMGYCGLGLASNSLERGWQVTGTCRDPQKVNELQKQGILAFEWNGQSPLSEDALQALASSHFIVSTIPPTDDTGRDPVIDNVGSQLLNCSGAENSARWVGYLSSTSVYGDWQGDWVDEKDCLPNEEMSTTASRKGAMRRKAEQQWWQAKQCHDLPVHIFRLGGIYGPGRNTLRAAALQREEESQSQRRRAGKRYTARIHVQDVCNVLHASMMQPRPGAVYNVVDNCDASRGEVLAFARELLGLEADVGGADEEVSAGKAVQRVGLDEKRVRNELIKLELGIRFSFPSYREGLAAIHAGDLRPFSRITDGSSLDII